MKRFTLECSRLHVDTTTPCQCPHGVCVNRRAYELTPWERDLRHYTYIGMATFVFWIVLMASVGLYLKETHRIVPKQIKFGNCVMMHDDKVVCP